MSIGPLANLAGGYLQSIISPVLKSAGITAPTTSNNASATGASGSDKSQLSPFAQLLKTLQQLQQSNPNQYQQVTQQISTNLQSAASTAQANGNTSAATELNTLSTDFKNASQSGQLPNAQDLAQAVGGGHHHHAHAASTPSNQDASASQTLSQLFASFQSSNAAQNASTDPMSIIENTLTSAGIGSGS